MASLGIARRVVLAVRGLQGRQRRLHSLRARVFEADLSDEQRDARVLAYITVRARQPWYAVAWHDVHRHVTASYSTPERSEAEVWRHHHDRLGISDAHRRPSCRLVRR